MDYKSDLNLDLVDLDHPGLESLVFKRVPLKDLQTCRKLGIALIAEQPAQVAEKEPCEVLADTRRPKAWSILF